METRVRVKRLIYFAGTFDAFIMGAAFISGQEIMQFFTAYGWWGIAGILLVNIIIIFEGWHFQPLIREHGIAEPFHAMEVILGKRMGQVLSVVFLVDMVISIIMMAAGAGAVVSENFGVPGVAGRTLVLGAAVLVVLLGLDQVTRVMGVVGPINIALLMIVSIASCISMLLPLPEGMALAPAEVAYAGSSRWWFAALKYAGTAAVSLIPMYVVCGGKSESIRESRISACTQLLPLTVVWVLIVIAQAGSITAIGSSQIPNIRLAQLHLPQLAPLFGVCILLGTFASTLVSLWSVVRRVAEEGTRRYRITTIVFGAAALLASGLLPFSHFVNLLFTTICWFGLAVIAILLYKTLFKRSR